MIKLKSLIQEGTHSHVGIIEPNGKINSVYTHYDGYPQNMKPAIKYHFKSDKDVKDYISKGGASGIYKGKEVDRYYGKSGGFYAKGDSKDIENYVKDVKRAGGAEFIYLYNKKDKKWYVVDTYGDKQLKKLY